MHVENNPDFKTVWQLAHNWINADPAKTDTKKISPELRIAILRLMRAIANQEITARQNGWKILTDDSFFSQLRDFLNMNNLKLFQCLRNDKFNKAYLDSIYVMRNEVVNWCNDVMRLPIPPCWAPQELLTKANTLAEAVDPDDENNSWYEKMPERRRQRVVCIELAKQLWKIHQNLGYEEMRNHPTMQQFGYSSTFSPAAFKKLVRAVASEYAKLPGTPLKSKK